MQDHDDFDFDPVPGLPELLPSGERMLWQGGPDWHRIAVSVFQIRWVSGYFLLLALFRGTEPIYYGAPMMEGLMGALWIVPLWIGTLAILLGISWLIQKTTVYTITDKRVVMRIGIALPLTLNLPFKEILSADFRDYGDRTGDIPLTLSGDSKIAYPVLWPHARPWVLRTPQPMLRGLPNAAPVARLLADAMSGKAVSPLISIKCDKVTTPHHGSSSDRPHQKGQDMDHEAGHETGHGTSGAFASPR